MVKHSVAVIPGADGPTAIYYSSKSSLGMDAALLAAGALALLAGVIYFFTRARK